MLTPEQFHKSESKYKPGDFKTSKEEIDFSKALYNENFNDTFTQEEDKGVGFAVIALLSLIILLSLTTAHYREEMLARERTINILEEDNLRLSKSSHNPFIHARK